MASAHSKAAHFYSIPKYDTRSKSRKIALRRETKTLTELVVNSVNKSFQIDFPEIR